ncbi:MAG TPA: sigma-70 family RNA polymerase sigma factor [Stellaceae bacterium]|nr:sigma-70 family RNA polymerase sigma factor [Stellaceae bacterium]
MLQPALEDHIAALRRYARALLGDRIEAEDLVQDCLARALSRAHLWRPGSDLRAWLFTILHNIHVNNVRSRHARLASVDASEGRSWRGMSAPPDQDTRLELRDLERALDRIPEEQRQVLLLVGMEGMSYDEAARIVGVPIGTIMSRVARGREALRRYMMHPGQEVEDDLEPAAAVAGRGAVRHLRRVK